MTRNVLVTLATLATVAVHAPYPLRGSNPKQEHDNPPEATPAEDPRSGTVHTHRDG